MTPDPHASADPVLADVDVVIPVRIDSDDRLANLAVVLAYFAESFAGARIWVLEHAAAARARDLAAAHGARHHFLESAGCFHKSRMLNLGIALADRPYVLLYDCDVLIPPAALVAARELARGGHDFVYPYNGLLLQIRRERLGTTGPAALLATLPTVVPDRAGPLPDGVTFLYGTPTEPSTGAALMAKRRALVLAGGYNENIVSYGCEDTELATRLTTLGPPPTWLAGFSAYHLAHRRGDDSHYNNYHASNLAEWNKVRAMDRDALATYVRNGFRALHLDPHGTVEIENTPTTFALRTRVATTVALPDVAFILPVPAPNTTLRAWVERALTELDATYDDFELHLVEIGSYGFQSSAHRDHVLYVHAPATPSGDWLAATIADTARPLVCVCSPFTDFSTATLLAALAEVRRAPDSCATIPDARPATAGPTAAGKLTEVLKHTLPLRGDALVFGRARYLAVEERGVGPPADPPPPLDLDALRHRLTANARRDQP